MTYRELFLKVEKQDKKIIAVIPAELVGNAKFLSFESYDFIY